MGVFGYKTRHERRWEEVRAQARDDLVALGDDIRALDIDVALPDASADAKQRYDQAVEAYERANEVFERASRPEDLEPVTSALEEGRWAMACAKALLAGDKPPERRPPCLFDPRHGPSTEDIEWAPPGGTPRSVPACAADALRIREGFDPHSRQVLVDGRPTNYWNAPAHYAPWAGGYFGGAGGGLLTGLLAGSVLGGAFGLGADLLGGGDWDDQGWDDQGGGWDDQGGFDGGGDLDLF